MAPGHNEYRVENAEPIRYNRMQTGVTWGAVNPWDKSAFIENAIYQGFRPLSALLGKIMASTELPFL